ncbi:M56 family metallopeptidase [Luteibacter yeojuensis]
MVVVFLALKSLLVAGATLVLLRLLRGRSAGERSTVAHLGLFAIVALPFGLLLPTTIPVPRPNLATTSFAGRANDFLLPVLTSARSSQSPIQRLSIARQTPLDLAKAGVRTLYLLPALALIARMLIALFRLPGLRARAEVLVDPLWLSALARAQRRMNFKSGTALLATRDLNSPVSWGLMRPTIVLDEAAADTPQHANAIVAHELAHIINNDWVKLILAQTATAMFWFNPCVWILAREAYQLREEAADDAVIAADIPGPDYAQLLVDVARHQSRRIPRGAHGIAASKNALRRRISGVLDHSRVRAPAGRVWMGGCAAGMLVMAVPLTTMAFAPEPEMQVLSERAYQKDADEIVRMHAANIAPGYERALADEGFAALTVDQLSGAQSSHITAAYAHALLKMGMPANFNDLFEARSLDLQPSYIAEMRALGIAGSFEDFRLLWTMGVRPDFVRRLKARGLVVISARQLVDLKATRADQ